MFFHLIQDRNSDNKFFLDHFNKCFNVVEHCGGIMVDYEELDKELAEMSFAQKTATYKQMKAAKAVLRNSLIWKDV